MKWSFGNREIIERNYATLKKLKRRLTKRTAATNLRKFLMQYRKMTMRNNGNECSSLSLPFTSIWTWLQAKTHMTSINLTTKPKMPSLTYWKILMKSQTRDYQTEQVQTNDPKRNTRSNYLSKWTNRDACIIMETARHKAARQKAAGMHNYGNPNPINFLMQTSKTISAISLAATNHNSSISTKAQHQEFNSFLNEI